MQHHVAAERLHVVFYLTFYLKILYLLAVHSRGGGTMQVCIASSTSGPTSFGLPTCLHIIYSGEVCGRDADDARLIRESVTAPTFVVGFSFPNSPAQ